MSLESILLPVNKIKLWAHQKDAVRMAVEYLQESSDKSFLVKMPTGTGKTGVFAVLTRIALPDYNYIIITPSKALKFQIVSELTDLFWNKIGYDLNKLKDQVITDLLPSNFEEVLEKIGSKHFIIVTTIQGLQQLSASQHEKFIKLKELIDYVIFDEGHKEPAYTWGQTVRSLRKNTILFSATPYRNDYKIFNVNKERFYLLGHELCAKINVLRQLNIWQLELPVNSIATFVNELVSHVEKLRPALIKSGIANPKVIIRCENEADIKKIVNGLAKLKKTVIGIHQTFSNTKNLFEDVPVAEDQKKYEYFIHQFKLVEGIDNPDFCILALHSNFSNSRMLIQQIGRILRNPQKQPNQFGYLFSTSSAAIKKEWDKYLAYDKSMSTKNKLFDITDILKVNKEASTLYFSGTFRELVDVNNISLEKTILFQKKVNALRHDNSLSFEELSTKIIDNWSKKDFSILKTEILEENKLLILYIIYSNSPLVDDGVFIEQKLAITYFHYERDFIFYYDSEQNNPWYEMENVSPVTREMLINVFHKKRRITKIHLHNTDIGNRNIRSKEIQSNTLEMTAPGLADHSFFPSRIEGYVSSEGNFQRRYLGFQFGKISDYGSKRFLYADFKLWLDELRKELNIRSGSDSLSRVLNRFSQKVDPPIDTTPICILLDLDDEVLNLYSFGEAKVELQFDDLCAVVVDGKFSLKINEVEFLFTIKYDLKYQKYLLICSELELQTEGYEEESPSLIGYLNSNQSFRIIISGNKFVYAFRSFFKPGLNLISKNKDLDLRQILNSYTCITAIKSEKGDASLPTNGIKWNKNTLFGLIANSGSGYNSPKLQSQFTFDFVVCDDLEDEIADFICLDTINQKIVLIHAKAGKSKLSASAFQDVCAQATKNLDYLIPFFSKEPSSNINKWGKKWSIGAVGKANRIVKGKCTASSFWTKYRALISNPATVREVWIFVGNILDYSKLNKELSKTNIEAVNPETIQLIYLLRSTWSSISSVSAQLKIFC